MKNLRITLLSIVCSASVLLSQTPSVSDTEQVRMTSGSISPATVLHAWTPVELATLLTAPDIPTGEALNRIVQLRDSAVAGLESLLSSDAFSLPKQHAWDTGNIAPSKVLLLLALGRIGSQRSYEDLYRVAASNQSTELTDVALNEINTECYVNACRGTLAPSTAIAELLVKRLPDGSFDGFLQKTGDQITRDGLSKWLNVDFHDPIHVAERNQLGKAAGKGLSDSEYRRQWWQNHKARLVWDKSSGHFIATK